MTTEPGFAASYTPMHPMIGRVRLVSVFRRRDVAPDQTVSSQLQDTDSKSRDATLHCIPWLMPMVRIRMYA